MDKIKQQQKILSALSQGRVSRKAFMIMGIASFTARCSELRKKGYDIKCIPLPILSDGIRRTEYELVTQ